MDVASALHRMPHLEVLELQLNHMGPAGGSAILASVANLQAIEAVGGKGLTSLRIGGNGVGATGLDDRLSYLTRLGTLDLSESGLRERDDYKTLGPALISLSASLTSLDLSRNHVDAFQTSISSLTGLTELTLSDVRLQVGMSPPFPLLEASLQSRT